MTSQFDYDLFVIGAGSGGVRASRIAAQLGAKVAIAESRYLGGTCVNVGCVPKKLFVYGSHVHDELAAASGYGWQIDEVAFSWRRLCDNKNSEISRLNNIYKNLLLNAGVSLFEGHAKIVDPHRIAINGEIFHAKYLLIATGGWPTVPTFPGSDYTITSNEVFYLPELPKSVVIYGGGYIAVEFAGIFNGLGVDTHLVYRGPLLLRGFDESIREHLSREIEKKGVSCHFNATINTIEKQAESGMYSVKLSSGQTLEVNEVMAATGRKGMLEGLGIENTSVALSDRGHIQVDENYQTSEGNIYAIGDVKGGIELTPVALTEGMTVANHLFGTKRDLSYQGIPTAVFSQPCAATVGLTEHQAREQFSSIEVYETQFRHLKHTLTAIEEKSFMKLVVDGQTNRVLGCHMVGQDAAEIIQGLAIAMKAGATKAHFDQTIGIHPTAAEEFVSMREISRT